MNFETWKEFYGWGFATISQLQQAVKENMLTEAQYTEITGQAYPVPAVKPAVIEPVHHVEPTPAPTNTPSAEAQAPLQ